MKEDHSSALAPSYTLASAPRLIVEPTANQLTDCGPVSIGPRSYGRDTILSLEKLCPLSTG